MEFLIGYYDWIDTYRNYYYYHYYNIITSRGISIMIGSCFERQSIYNRLHKASVMTSCLWLPHPMVIM